MNGIIEMPNMKDRKENTKTAEKPKLKNSENWYDKTLRKYEYQLILQSGFRTDVIDAGLDLVRNIFEKDNTSIEERSAAIRLLVHLTCVNGMPRIIYTQSGWKKAFKGDAPFYQFAGLTSRSISDEFNGIEYSGYVIKTIRCKVKVRDDGFVRAKRIYKAGTKKCRYVRVVYMHLFTLLQYNDKWDDFRKRVVFHTDSIGRVKTVTFIEGGVMNAEVPATTGKSENVCNMTVGSFADTDSVNMENTFDQSADDNGLFNKMNETISYLNSLSELEGWSAWHGTEYRRTDSKDHIAVIVPDKLSGVGTATWYELFDPGYEKPKYVDLVKRHVEAVLRDKYDYTISYPTKTEIEDEIFEADAHAWISHPDTEKCGFAYTKYGNITHFRKNMKLAIFPMITITEKSDNT